MYNQKGVISELFLIVILVGSMIIVSLTDDFTGYVTNECKEELHRVYFGKQVTVNNVLFKVPWIGKYNIVTMNVDGLNIDMRGIGTTKDVKGVKVTNTKTYYSDSNYKRWVDLKFNYCVIPSVMAIDEEFIDGELEEEPVVPTKTVSVSTTSKIESDEIVDEEEFIDGELDEEVPLVRPVVRTSVPIRSSLSDELDDFELDSDDFEDEEFEDDGSDEISEDEPSFDVLSEEADANLEVQEQLDDDIASDVDESGLSDITDEDVEEDISDVELEEELEISDGEDTCKDYDVTNEYSDGKNIYKSSKIEYDRFFGFINAVEYDMCAIETCWWWNGGNCEIEYENVVLENYCVNGERSVSYVKCPSGHGCNNGACVIV